jgi:hypothetical protein
LDLEQLELFVSWVVFLCFFFIHYDHFKQFQGASEKYRHALGFSTLCGMFAFVGLLVFCFIKGSWYQPLLLLVLGLVCCGVILGVLKSKIGILPLSLIALVGWPTAAVWVFYTINSSNATL